VLSGADRDRFARRCTKFDQDALPPIYENDEISCRKVLENVRFQDGTEGKSHQTTPPDRLVTQNPA
jgi:hypothetical protein